MKKHLAIPLIILLLLLVSTAGHLHILKAQGRNANDASEDTVLDIPSVIGGYTQLGEDIPVAENVKRVLQTSSILTRNYRAPNGRIVSLSMVHAGKTRRSLHFPEVCLVGQGWEVMRQFQAPVGFGFTAQHLVIANGRHKEAVIYWFKTRDQLTGNFFLNSWYWAREQLRPGGTPTSTMTRLSTAIRGQDEESAFFLLEDMAEQLAPVLLQRIP